MNIETIDLVVLDVVMPELSGLDVLRRIRHSEKLRNIPVLLFTALGREVDMMLKPENKANGYLAKPFTRKQMVREVLKLLT